MTGPSPDLSGLAEPDQVKAYVKAISEFLHQQRAFTKDVQLLLLFETTSLTAARARHLHGVYFDKGEHKGKPCYQHIRIENRKFVCSGIYIFWSPEQQSWKVGELDENQTAQALCACDADTENPSVSTKPWSVLKHLPEQEAESVQAPDTAPSSGSGPSSEPGPSSGSAVGSASAAPPQTLPTQGSVPGQPRDHTATGKEQSVSTVGLTPGNQHNAEENRAPKSPPPLPPGYTPTRPNTGGPKAAPPTKKTYTQVVEEVKTTKDGHTTNARQLQMGPFTGHAKAKRLPPLSEGFTAMEITQAGDDASDEETATVTSKHSSLHDVRMMYQAQVAIEAVVEKKIIEITNRTGSVDEEQMEIFRKHARREAVDRVKNSINKQSITIVSEIKKDELTKGPPGGPGPSGGPSASGSPFSAPTSTPSPAKNTSNAGRRWGANTNQEPTESATPFIGPLPEIDQNDVEQSWARRSTVKHETPYQFIEHTAKSRRTVTEPVGKQVQEDRKRTRYAKANLHPIQPSKRQMIAFEDYWSFVHKISLECYGCDALDEPNEEVHLENNTTMRDTIKRKAESIVNPRGAQHCKHVENVEPITTNMSTAGPNDNAPFGDANEQS